MNNSGKYRCNATNVDGGSAVSTEAELISNHVTENIKCCFSYNFIVWPQILVNPSDITVFIGESALLTCTALGTDIVYRWMKDSMLVSRANSNILRINDIMGSQEGVYKCMVSNKGGTVESNPASITVYGKYKLFCFIIPCIYARQTS